MQIEINAEQADAFRKAGVPVKVTYSILLKDVVAAQLDRPATLERPLPPEPPKPLAYKRSKSGTPHKYPRGTRVRLAPACDNQLARVSPNSHQRQVMEAVRMVLKEGGNEFMLRSELSKMVTAIIGDNAIGRSASSVLTDMLDRKMLESI